MAIRINITSNQFAALGAKVQSQASSVVRKVTLDIHGTAVQNSPVDEGNLRASHAVEFEGDMTGIVAVGADYGVYVHEGHATRGGGYVAGRPWLADAANHHESSFHAAMGQVMKP